MPPTVTQPDSDSRHTILVVDDTPANLAVIGGLLTPQYRVRVANSAQRALTVVKLSPQPDLILLDIMMPDTDGYQVIKELKADPQTHDIPVIFVTAMDGDDDEEKGLVLGAVDYVTKPIRPAILLARVKAHLELKQSRDWLANQNDYLEREVQRRMHENELIKDLSLHALATLAEKRDNETGNHLLRTRAYVEALIEQLKDHPRFSEALREPQRGLIAKAAPLHDIGKVGIPDHILLKPARLTPDEFSVMKQHAQIGADALGEAIGRALSSPSPDDLFHSDEDKPALAFLEVARQIAQSHHEKWDGSGYPHGLRGDAIPVAARLMALADVYDALSCRRHYKEPFPLEQVEQILREGRGTHFDPDVLDAYFQVKNQFLDIAHRFSDTRSATA